MRNKSRQRSEKTVRDPRPVLRRLKEEASSLPPIALSDLPYIELSGQNHMELDGIHKILEYRSNCLRIRFCHVTVCFIGEGLCMRYFSGKNAVVQGVIREIKFE